MPHIQIRATRNIIPSLDVRALLANLVLELSACESIEPAAIKCLLVPIDEWVMGEGAPEGFVHCEVSLLSGRSTELRKQVSMRMFEVLGTRLADQVSNRTVGVTVEIREMDKETYLKT
ncbi:MAG: hypothetical protein ABL949_02590 [Fimbriimonadaceae bacterium]